MKSNYTPVPKVLASGAAGAVTTIVVWVIAQFGGIEVPPTVAAAFTTLFSLAAGYWAPRSPAPPVDPPGPGPVTHP